MDGRAGEGVGGLLWRAPPHPVLETVFRHLLALEDGCRWVRGGTSERLGAGEGRAGAWGARGVGSAAPAAPYRQRPPRPRAPYTHRHLLPCAQLRNASHTCAYWRAAAQDVLLADTAISRPPPAE